MNGVHQDSYGLNVHPLHPIEKVNELQFTRGTNSDDSLPEQVPPPQEAQLVQLVPATCAVPLRVGGSESSTLGTGVRFSTASPGAGPASTVEASATAYAMNAMKEIRVIVCSDSLWRVWRV